MHITFRSVLWGSVSGLLLAVAYRIPGMWPLEFFALIPLLWLAWKEESRLSVFASGAIAGLILTGISIEWFFATLPLPQEFGVSSPAAGAIFVFINWFLAILVMGPWVGMWALALRELSLARSLDLLSAAFLFPAFEWARMFTFNLITVAPGIGNPLFFSPGFLGYPLADSEQMRQFAHWGGVSLLSFIAVAANLLFFRFLFLSDSPKTRIGGVALTAAGLAFFSLFPFIALRENAMPNAPHPDITVAVVSLDAPSRFSGADFSRFDEEARAVVTQALEEKADLVVLPEDSRLLFPFSTTTYASLGVTGGIVLDSGPVVDKEGQRVSRSFANRESGTTYLRDKTVLTPDGEYLMTVFHVFLSVLGLQHQADAFEAQSNYTNGTESHPLNLGFARASVLFCLEVLEPGIAKDLVTREKSSLLLIPSSHAWFHASAELEQDVLRLNQVQAVEAGVPAVVSVNGAPGYVLDKYGRVIAKTDSSPAFALTRLSL